MITNIERRRSSPIKKVMIVALIILAISNVALIARLIIVKKSSENVMNEMVYATLVDAGFKADKSDREIIVNVLANIIKRNAILEANNKTLREEVDKKLMDQQ